MHVISPARFGMSVRNLTPAEMYACVHYALGERPDFDLSSIGCNAEAVNKYATSGYNALIDQGAFELDEELGLPVIALTGVNDLIDFASALSTASEVLTMRIKLSKSSFLMYYVHNDVSWAFFWKKKGNPNAKADKTQEQWFVSAGPMISTPSLTWLDLTGNARKNVRDGRKLTISFNWLDVTDHDNIMRTTTFTTDKHGWYVEDAPMGPGLVPDDDEGEGWPRSYGCDYLLAQRVEALLEA